MKLKFPRLGNRLLTALGGREPASEAHSDRLRDVLGRDRALAVGARAQARSPAPGPRHPPPALTVVGTPVEPSVPTPTADPVAPAAPSGAPAATADPVGPAAPSGAPAATAAPVAPAAPGSPAPEPAAAASAASDERPQRVQHEPIRTRTMARLLATQGYRQRALAIYEELLLQAGADDSLRAEVEALRARPG
jgi:hypothetical protein